MDEIVLTKIIGEEACHFVDRLENVYFGEIRRRSSDGFYAAKLVRMSNIMTADALMMKHATWAASDYQKGSKAAALWHVILECANKKTIKIMTNSYKYGIKIADELDSQKCQIFMMTKQPKRKFTHELMNESRTVTINAEICGPKKWDRTEVVATS